MIVAALQPCQLWSVLVKSRRSRCRWANMMSLKMFKRVTRSPKELSAKTLRIQLEWDSFCCCAKGDNLKVEIKRFSSMPDLTRPCQDQSFADTNTQKITPALNFSHKSIGNCKRQLWLAFMWEGSFSLSLFTLPSSRPIFTGKWFCNELHAELRGLDWSANIYIFFLIYIIYKKKTSFACGDFTLPTWNKNYPLFSVLLGNHFLMSSVVCWAELRYLDWSATCASIDPLLFVPSRFGDVSTYLNYMVFQSSHHTNH